MSTSMGRDRSGHDDCCADRDSMAGTTTPIRSASCPSASSPIRRRYTLLNSDTSDSLAASPRSTTSPPYGPPTPSNRPQHAYAKRPSAVAATAAVPINSPNIPYNSSSALSQTASCTSADYNSHNSYSSVDHWESSTSTGSSTPCSQPHTVDVAGIISASTTTTTAPAAATPKAPGKSSPFRGTLNSFIRLLADCTGINQSRRDHAAGPRNSHHHAARVRLRVNMASAQASHSYDMVHFIAGGQRFCCPEWILATHPDTLLGNADKRRRYYSTARKCYVFPDTLPDVFNAVLEYYEGEMLMRPGRVGLRVYLEQVELFELDPKEVQDLLIREGIRFEHFTQGHTHINYEHFKHPLHAQLWDILENPETGVWAKFISALSMGLTLLSVVLFCLETLPELDYLDVDGEASYSAPRNPIFILNTICVVYFSLELIIRFIVCPSKKAFAKNWMNWVDLFAVVPYFVTLTMILGDVKFQGQTSKFAAVRVIRLFRILRIFDLSRHYKLKSVGVLIQAIKNNFDIIAVLIFLLIICDILFSGFIYAVEGGPNTAYTSIPAGFWWAVISMTSVGYGDSVPKRAAGQFVACVCGVVGLIFIAFVLQSIASEFHALMKTYSEYNAYLKLYDHDKRAEHHTVRSKLLAEDDYLGPEITVSVNGAEFIFKQYELDNYPNSLLGNVEKRRPYYNPKEKLYFFPRNTDIFPAIHYYYRSNGALQRPPYISLRRFIDEVEFFQLGREAIIPLLELEGIYIVETQEPDSPRQKYWFHVFENLEYNTLAKIVAAISIGATGTSVLVFCLETMEVFQSWNCSLPDSYLNNASQLHVDPHYHHVYNTSRATFGTLFTENCTGPAALFIVETMCVTWFIFELIIRFAVSPRRWKFLRSALNFIDFLAILPYFVSLAELFYGETSTLVVVNTLGLLRTIRLIKLVRLFKFSRHSRRIQMIAEILKATWAELGLAVYFLLIASVLFGSLAYIAETDSEGEEHISSIPRGMYWAWITMLTIGYGDVVPMTAWGKLVGSVCAVIGLVFWSIPMTFVSDKFDVYRRLYKDRDYLMGLLQKLKLEAQQELQQESMRKTENGPNVTQPLLIVSDNSGENIPLDDRHTFRRTSSRKSVSLSALNHSCQPGSTSILSLQFGDEVRSIDGENSRPVFGALGITLNTDATPATPAHGYT
ncbi:uncharacterized protein LOC129596176 [Paramacrobiotus metropolitanus]|uniref:uncharacterized protein LOC129596176 n=1 Tax=Paramacrobiotus metropolitanus TaxID=2943436 RepID=UPI0024463468|nr:uncharacterized protein LOC129596176 [Paramacrobiotus metropolitanus]XP_055349349.1 uncharacterized protein LOC129596176 [Paramacrobiotus metropolitanus]